MLLASSTWAPVLDSQQPYGLGRVVPIAGAGFTAARPSIVVPTAYGLGVPMGPGWAETTTPLGNGGLTSLLHTVPQSTIRSHGIGGMGEPGGGVRDKRPQWKMR